MRINFEELECERRENFRERMRFVKLWAEFVRGHDDKVWSSQQNDLIDGQGSY